MFRNLISAIRKNSEEEALRCAEELIRKNPSNGHNYLRMGDLLIKKGAREEAIEYYLKAAFLFYKQGFIKKAMVAAKIVLRYDEGNKDARYLIEKIQTELEGPEETVLEKPSEQDSRFSIFNQLSDDEIEELLKRARKKGFNKGEYIIIEGDVGDALYIIQKGRVRVVTSIGGKTIELATLGQGDIVGEISLLTDRPRTASVIALEETECYEIDRPIVMGILERHPDIADALNELYHQRVKNTLRKVKEK